MKELSDHDNLWNLLGHVQQTTVSPWFVRRVLQKIRLQKASPLISYSILRWLEGIVVVLIVMGFSWSLISYQEKFTASYEFQKAFDAAADLEALVAVEDISLSFYINSF